MAKPILLVRTPEWLIGERAKFITDNLTRHLLYEYHVLVVYDSKAPKTTFETLNDIKGLKDTDIEKLIDKYINQL